MRPITFNKVLFFPAKVLAINDVYLEDDIKYSLKDHDLQLEGKIILKGKAILEVEEKEIFETIDVDCLLSLSSIDCVNDLRLGFKDYSVFLDERIVRFIIRYELQGNGEKIISFKEIAGKDVEDLVIRALNRSFDIDNEQFDEKKIKALLNSGDLDIIGAEDLLPLLSQEIDDSEVVLEEEIEVIEEPLKIIKEEHTMEVVPSKTPLFNEKYSIAFFFFKVDNDEVNYESLARKFGLKEEDLRLANNNKELSVGRLVKIPK